MTRKMLCVKHIVAVFIDYEEEEKFKSCWKNITTQ